jgi:hypothetical protein
MDTSGTYKEACRNTWEKVILKFYLPDESGRKLAIIEREFHIVDDLDGHLINHRYGYHRGGKYEPQLCATQAHYRLMFRSQMFNTIYTKYPRQGYHRSCGLHDNNYLEIFRACPNQMQESSTLPVIFAYTLSILRVSSKKYLRSPQQDFYRREYHRRHKRGRYSCKG